MYSKGARWHAARGMLNSRILAKYTLLPFLFKGNEWGRPSKNFTRLNHSGSLSLHDEGVKAIRVQRSCDW